MIIAAIPRLWLASSSSLDEVMVRPGVDAEGYEILAQNLLAGRGFSLDTAPPYRPDSLRTPLYPVLIAALYAVMGPLPRLVVFCQVLLDSVTAALVSLIATRLALPRAGFVAGLVYALTPSQWRYASSLLTESPLAFLITAGTGSLVLVPGALRMAVVVGLAGATAVLCKPNVLPIPAIWAVAAAWRVWPRWQVGFVTAAVTMVLLTPWIVRNTVVFGRPMLSTAFENNLAHVTAVATLARVQGEHVILWSDRWEELYGSILATTEAQYGFRFAHERKWSPREADLRWRQVGSVAGEIILQHPTEAIITHLEGAPQVWWGPLGESWWFPYEYRYWYSRITRSDWPWFEAQVEAVSESIGQALRLRQPMGAWQLFWQWATEEALWHAGVFWLAWHLFFFVQLALVVLGVWHLRSEPAILFVLLAAMLYMTLHTGPIGYERFRVPVVPLVAVLVGVGASSLLALPPPHLRASMPGWRRW
jgi:hypothetical protein